jgi:hypothetical protein
MDVLFKPVGGKGSRIIVQSSGNWNNGANAGVWAVNLNNNRSNSNANVGFRSDYDSTSNLIVE